VATAFVVTGCGDDEEAGDWEYIEKNGKIIVGLDATFAPMGFTDKDGNIIGFDVDLAKAVGKKLGVDMEFKSIDWDAKYTELDAKNIDCIWNGMSATPERAEKLSLSKEYFNNKIVVMTLKDDVKVDKPEDLANYNVGIQADSSALEVVKEDKAYDKFKDKIKEYKSYDDAITDMEAGRMDCVVIDEVLGNYKNTKMKNALKECKYNFGDDFYAIGFRKDDKELTTKVNDALQELIDEGEAAKISKKWFGKDLVILQDYEAE
jgi:polar amino acid transport system substrate-binding protein